MKLKFRATVKDFIIFIIFAIFLLYLVSITVANLNSFSSEVPYFTGLNPLPAFKPELVTATITFYILTLVLLGAMCSSKFYDREKGFGFGTPKEKDDGYIVKIKD